MPRGMLTEEVANKAKELFGYDITQKELRLVPYVHYELCNSQRLDPRRIDEEERKILSMWREKGWLSGGACEMSVTKEFWDKLNEILWLAYVDYD